MTNAARRMQCDNIGLNYELRTIAFYKAKGCKVIKASTFENKYHKYDLIIDENPVDVKANKFGGFCIEYTDISGHPGWIRAGAKYFVFWVSYTKHFVVEQKRFFEWICKHPRIGLPPSNPPVGKARQFGNYKWFTRTNRLDIIIMLPKSIMNEFAAAEPKACREVDVIGL